MPEPTTEPHKVVVVATDEPFCLPTAVTLWSLDQRGGGPFTVKILHDRVPDETQALVAASMASTGSRIEWIDMVDHVVPTTDGMHLPRAANFRLLLDDVDLGDARRVLYLDTDTLIMGPIDTLWDLDLEGRTAGAVRSVNFPTICTYGAIDNWPDLDLDPRAPYFNSGVLLIDVERWRARDIGPRTIGYVRSFDARRNADQEGLNVALADDWLELDPTWNQQSPLLAHNRGAAALYPDEVLDAARHDPRIIHFTDRPKPWDRDCVHPARDAWRSAAAATAFAPITLDRTGLVAQAGWRMKRAMSALVKGR